MRCLLLIVLLAGLPGYSQKILDLHYSSVFGTTKSFQFFNNSRFSYKLKGDVFYRRHKLVNMEDSLLVFDNDEVVTFSQIKAVKIRGASLSPYFFGAGARFFILDTGHGAIFGRQQVVSDQALIVLGSCVAGGLIVKYFQDKHIRIKKNSVFRIIDADYRNLQPDSKPSSFGITG